MVRAFCRPHAYTFNADGGALTPETDVTSEKVTWLTENPPAEIAVSASLEKIKSINQHIYI